MLIPAPWDVWGFVATYAPTSVVAAITVYAGYVQSLPWGFIIPAAAVAFAATAHGLLRISEWRQRNRVQSKLLFIDILWGIDYEISESMMVISAIQYRLVLQNMAALPIHFKIERMESSFSGRSQRERIETRGVVLDGRPSQVSAQRVPLNPPIKLDISHSEAGDFVFEVSYGRSESKRPYRIAHRVRTRLKHVGENQLDRSWTYSEDEQIIKPSD